MWFCGACSPRPGFRKADGRRSPFSYENMPAPNSPRGGCFFVRLSCVSLVASRWGEVVKCGPPDEGADGADGGGRMCGGGNWACDGGAGALDGIPAGGGGVTCASSGVA